jgi:hypothetical protein
MPVATVIRPAHEAPRIGGRYAFMYGGRAFEGEVVKHTRLSKAKAHVNVHVELSKVDHRRLMGIGEPG